MQVATIDCECGCGTAIPSADRHGRPRRFVRGHWAKVMPRDRDGQRRQRFMSLEDAKRIAGRLGEPSKMPGYAYGLDPFQCRKGSELARIPGSVCSECYARTPNYTRWPGVMKGWQDRMRGTLDNPRWSTAMVELVTWAGERSPWFRWHDSGDLMYVGHLHAIAEVAAFTPNVRHWLPTREYGLVEQYLEHGGRIPENLCIRLSAFMIGEAPELPAELAHLPTSTVNTERGKPVQVSDRRKDSIECRAYTRGGECGSCRACWDPRVKNISYPTHGNAAKRSDALAVLN